MSCSSLTALPRECNEGVIAGLERVYMIAFKDLQKITGSEEVFSADTTGTVVQINTSNGFVEIGLLKSTSGLEEKLTKDPAKGTCYFTQTFKLVLGDLTSANQNFIASVVNQPVAVIYKTRTGLFFVVGLNGQFEVTSVTGGTGVAESDMIGYQVDFAGISKTTAPLVSSALVTTLCG